jgi:hypothetical protein
MFCLSHTLPSLHNDMRPIQFWLKHAKTVNLIGMHANSPNYHLKTRTRQSRSKAIDVSRPWGGFQEICLRNSSPTSHTPYEFPKRFLVAIKPSIAYHVIIAFRDCSFYVVIPAAYGTWPDIRFIVSSLGVSRLNLFSQFDGRFYREGKSQS